MDFNVFCTDENYFFRLGISKVIEEAFLSDAKVNFLSGSDRQCLEKADFILINVSQWRLYMCQPAYRARKPGSIIMVFVDESADIIMEQLPVCYRSLIVLSRLDPVSKIADKLMRAAVNFQGPGRGFQPSDCLNCDFARITVIQLQVLSFLKKGYSVSQTASRLDLAAKTIYAHKYNVMRKFSLRGDREFNAFINDLSLLELYRGVISPTEV
ncbi:helix-turn-helix transcriptional regulator [Pantoea deleyi]|uniref:LuxR family transcriptional regulator n=1 Tax=Pantoea deleyi TaxID=470932 RepID=A0A506QJI2_9GAMM|nr:helix-turn-helix transcriptional regulator [Pantoea deleyi]ORM81595.1 helix-turn-helix transcriptional regulator [Pantoea deleyi]TPV45208.1 LuxR family transcriptional regulator [Pantoea deleyi]